jgi:hypothetical protein
MLFGGFGYGAPEQMSHRIGVIGTGMAKGENEANLALLELMIELGEGEGVVGVNLADFTLGA